MFFVMMELCHCGTEDLEAVQWKLRKSFDKNSSHILDIQFGASPTGLKLVVAYSDSQVWELARKGNI